MVLGSPFPSPSSPGFPAAIRAFPQYPFPTCSLDKYIYMVCTTLLIKCVLIMRCDWSKKHPDIWLLDFGRGQDGEGTSGGFIPYASCCAGHQWEEKGGTFVSGGGLAWGTLQWGREKTAGQCLGV